MTGGFWFLITWLLIWGSKMTEWLEVIIILSLRLVLFDLTTLLPSLIAWVVTLAIFIALKSTPWLLLLLSRLSPLLLIIVIAKALVIEIITHMPHTIGMLLSELIATTAISKLKTTVLCLMLTLHSILLSFHELVAFSIFHGRSILDRLLMLFIVQSDTRWVQIEEVSDLVRHIGAHFIIATIFQPNLQKSLLRTQWHTCANHIRLFKLFTYESEQNLLPHFVNIVSFLHFEDHNATMWRFLPHGYEILSEQEDVDFSRHLSWFFHVQIVVEKVLDRWNASQWLQLVSITFLLLSFDWLGLAINLGDTLQSLNLVLSIERWVSLVVPELPACLEMIAFLWQEMTLWGQWLLRDIILWLLIGLCQIGYVIVLFVNDIDLLLDDSDSAMRLLDFLFVRLDTNRCLSDSLLIANCL